MSIRAEIRYRNPDLHPPVRSLWPEVPDLSESRARPAPPSGSQRARHGLTVAATRSALRIGLVAVMLAGLLLVVFIPGADAGLGPRPAVEHVVRPGDTLWSIAAAHTPPSGDTRRTVLLIRKANAAASPLLTVGDVVTVPVGDIAG